VEVLDVVGVEQRIPPQAAKESRERTATLGEFHEPEGT
jgi:hypothetical protein